MMPKLSIYMYFVRIVAKFYDGQQKLHELIYSQICSDEHEPPHTVT